MRDEEAALDRVFELEELPLETEALREVPRERLHAEPLRRVVTGGDEVDAELARGRAGSAPRARPSGRGRSPRARRRSGRCRRRPSRSRRARSAPGRGRRRAARGRRRRRRARRTRRSRSARRAVPPSPTSPKGRSRSTPSAAASCALLPSSGCASSARWYASEREVAGEERLEPASLAPVDDARLVAPEDPVVHEHELGAGGRRALEQLDARRRRRTRASSPRRRRRPAGPAARTPGSARPRAARRRSGGSRPGRPRGDSRATRRRSSLT